MSLREKLLGLGKQVQTLRDKQNKQWFEIGQELEMAPGKALLAYEVASLKESEIFRAKTEAGLAKEIKRLRDNEGLSWGRIAAKVDTPESTCRSLYDPDLRGRGHRIGKGGRYPGDSTPAAKGTKGTTAAKKGTAKSSPAKAAGKKVEPKKVPLSGMSQDQLTARLTGKRIKIEREDGRTRSLIVGGVVNLTKKGGNVTVSDSKGKEHTFGVNDIVSAAA